MSRDMFASLMILSGGIILFAATVYLYSPTLPFPASPSSVLRTKRSLETSTTSPVSLQKIQTPYIVSSKVPFIYSFNSDGILQEAASADESSSIYWWLDSGGELIIGKNMGQTLQGELPQSDPWREEYARENPEDTADGRHPQNLFRLVSQASWANVAVQAFFKIVKDNLDTSENRNESNGILLFARYENSATLYYAGLRVDGTAVIKKKYHGEYYTLAQKQILPGTYNRISVPDLMPHDQWIGLRAEAKTDSDGVVHLRFYILLPNSKTWRLALGANDNGGYDRTPPIASGHIGIRTDFMDVQFSNFKAETI